MNEYQQIMKAEIGEMVTIKREIQECPCPVEYFAKISDYGRSKHAILLESADIIEKYGERSIGASDPCLKVTGRGEEFIIKALNKLGVHFLDFIQDKLDYCDYVNRQDDTIKGILKPNRDTVNEYERLKQKTHADILRVIAFAFQPKEYQAFPYGGLFGAISYDFIDQFEDLPANKSVLIGDPDYEMYFVDNLFVMDHEKKKLMLVANALITERSRDEIYVECMRKLAFMENQIHEPVPQVEARKMDKYITVSDTSKEKYIQKVEKLKDHIIKGDVFQAVLARTIITESNDESLNVYRRLRRINPSPYMFYFTSDYGVLLGASPEMFVKVEGEKEKVVEIRPIAGTKPRGIVNGKVDHDLDSRFEAELKLDPKELAEHTMLIDLARNDVARISKPGTRYVDEPFIIEKYSHVQHLVSNVSGVLKDDLDALHAYLVSMNMGTLTGAPKVEAMKLLRMYEENKRGYYGGSVGFLTPSGDFDSCIVIRSMRIKGERAYVQAGAGIVYDSIPENEYLETERKAAAAMAALIDRENA